jgi:L-ribulose-5-phosphate 3-epimerase
MPSNSGRDMPLGLLVTPSEGSEETIKRLHDIGFPTCFFSLDAYIGEFKPKLAAEIKGLLAKYTVTCTTVEVVGPQPLVWDFMQGPSTIGLVPRAIRAARIDALRQASDFAKLLGVHQVQTHCGFIPENPVDPLYKETVAAIKDVAQHCAKNNQRFLMETGQETPTTMLRAIRDVNMPNLGVGLDTANLILMVRLIPSTPFTILGPYVHAVHAKDGGWPTDPDKLGEEVLIGTGLVDFEKVFAGSAQRRPPVPSPSNAKPAVRNRSKTSAMKSGIWKKCSRRLSRPLAFAKLYTPDTGNITGSNGSTGQRVGALASATTTLSVAPT